MSIDDLTAFFAKLQEDPALQEKARAVSGSDDERLSALCGIAAEAGYTVTTEDLRSEQAQPAVAALDEGVLQHIVGGAGGCTIPGSTNPQITPMG